MAARRYYMLMCSLPALPPLPRARQLPISRLRLEDRLRLLEDTDARDLDAVESLLRWPRLAPELPDEGFVARAAATQGRLHDASLAALLAERLEVRTVLAALRRRAKEPEPPARGASWGCGRHVDHIRRNWQHRLFRLGAVHPWLDEAERLMATGAARELERHLLGILWTKLTARAQQHYFDLLAVAVYVLKWDLLEACLAADGAAAVARFDGLAAEVLRQAEVAER